MHTHVLRFYFNMDILSEKKHIYNGQFNCGYGIIREDNCDKNQVNKKQVGESKISKTNVNKNNKKQC